MNYRFFTPRCSGIKSDRLLVLYLNVKNINIQLSNVVTDSKITSIIKITEWVLRFCVIKKFTSLTCVKVNSRVALKPFV